MIKKMVTFLACIAVFAGQAQDFQAGGAVTGKQTRRERFDRGLAFDTKTPAMPKGMWVAGLNASYSQHSNDDYKILLVKDFRSVGHTVNISPMVHYVFANNQSVGLRFQYRRNMFDLDRMSLDLGDLTDGGSAIGPYKYLSQTYMGYISYRYYITMGSSKRLLLFNEIQAGIGGGQQEELSGTGDGGGGYKTGTFQNSLQVKAGIMPGAIFFVTNQFAIELAINLLGFNYQNLKQTTDQTYKGGRTASSISTKLDLLSLQFGMTLYL